MFDIEPTVVKLSSYPPSWASRPVLVLLQAPMAADGQKDWVELYRSALMELDRAHLPGKIDAATSAIQLRINELLQYKNTSQEHLQLEDALRNLRSLRRQTE